MTSANLEPTDRRGNDVTYYAKARNADGAIAQLLVTKGPGRPTRQRWTGKVYRSDRAADADLLALNGGAR